MWLALALDSIRLRCSTCQRPVFKKSLYRCKLVGDCQKYSHRLGYLTMLVQGWKCEQGAGVKRWMRWKASVKAWQGDKVKGWRAERVNRWMCEMVKSWRAETLNTWPGEMVNGAKDKTLDCHCPEARNSRPSLFWSTDSWFSWSSSFWSMQFPIHIILKRKTFDPDHSEMRNSWSSSFWSTTLLIVIILMHIIVIYLKHEAL